MMIVYHKIMISRPNERIIAVYDDVDGANEYRVTSESESRWIVPGTVSPADD